jgi:nicotinamide riboside kinase
MDDYSPPAPNPFAVSAIRPGAIPFIFREGTEAVDLIDALEDEHGWRGQIIGPHGSGKSTLLAALKPELEADGRRVLLYTLRDGQHSIPDGLRTAPADRQPTILVIDGYEQLRPFSRWCLRLVCRLRGWALLVTAHRDMGLPTLWETRVTAELAENILRHLLSDKAREISRAQIEGALARHQDNLRAVLFELYDEFERNRR